MVFTNVRGRERDREVFCSIWPWPRGWRVSCRIDLSKIARFKNEDEIYETGGRHTSSYGRGDTLCAAADALRAAGYDGLVDLYNTDGSKISYGVLVPKSIRISGIAESDE